MTQVRRVALVLVVISSMSIGLPAQAGRYALESAANLRLHNVAVEAATLDGKKGVRVAISAEMRRRIEQMSAEERARFEPEELAVIQGTDFGDGIIEAEIAGVPAPDAGPAARGFVGIAFRVQDDLKTYDAFYLRPTNGRADDQERRNHSVQYISHPDWPWFRLRKETPERYEAYVDLVPATWTKLKVEVRGTRARLYVHDQTQPTLIVNDVKSGAQRRGAVALWVGPGTIAHFRNLTISQ